MIELTTVYQRSKKGRNEIVRKCHGLTRCERLVLIVIDGIAPAEEIRERLKVLSDDGFHRAIEKLLALDLIGEAVCAPVDFVQRRETNEMGASHPRKDALASVTVVCSDSHFDFSLAAVAAAPDYSSPCPNVSTALALEEWTKLRGWHVRWHGELAKPSTCANQRASAVRKASAFTLPCLSIGKRLLDNIGRTPDLAGRVHAVSRNGGGKRPFATSVLIASAALVGGVMAVVR